VIQNLETLEEEGMAISIYTLQIDNFRGQLNISRSGRDSICQCEFACHQELGQSSPQLHPTEVHSRCSVLSISLLAFSTLGPQFKVTENAFLSCQAGHSQKLSTLSFLLDSKQRQTSHLEHTVLLESALGVFDMNHSLNGHLQHSFFSGFQILNIVNQPNRITGGYHSILTENIDSTQFYWLRSLNDQVIYVGGAVVVRGLATHSERNLSKDNSFLRACIEELTEVQENRQSTRSTSVHNESAIHRSHGNSEIITSQFTP